MEDLQARSYWMITSHVVDRAGALTSVASAFSNRTINIDTVIAHGTDEQEGPNGRVMITFWATEAEKEMMLRITKRLSKITRVECVAASYERQHEAIRTAVGSIAAQ